MWLPPISILVGLLTFRVDHIGYTGSTTAMLFAATPVHTQFSATTTGSLHASGANVALTLSNGTLYATNLLPATISATGSTTFYPTNPETVTLKNTGSVPETFTMIISQYACGSLAQLPSGNVANALGQLLVNYSVTTPSSSSALSSGTVAPFRTAAITSCATSGLTSVGSSPIKINLGSMAPLQDTTVTLKVELAASSGANANDWNGATNVLIPCTIQAEPDDGAATPGTPTAPTLSTSTQQTSLQDAAS